MINGGEMEKITLDLVKNFVQRWYVVCQRLFFENESIFRCHKLESYSQPLRHLKLPWMTLYHKMPHPILNKNGRVGSELLLHIPRPDDLVITVTLLLRQLGNLSLSDREQRIDKNPDNRRNDGKQSPKIRDRVNLPIPDGRHSLHLQPNGINLIIKIIRPRRIYIRFLKIPDNQPKHPHGAKQLHHTPQQRLLSKTRLKRKHTVRFKTIHIAYTFRSSISPH
jgi:hypothetical protein